MKKLPAFLLAMLLVLTSAAGLAFAETTGETFSLWNPDAPARNALVEYLAAVTDETSPDCIPVKDRIAVFDMDGTLMCETDPFCFEYMVFADYALNHTDKMPEEVLAVAREILDAAGGAKPSDMSVRQAAAAAVAYQGMTMAELSAVVEDFKASEAWGFTGMTRGEAWYRPMVQLVEQLQANGFTVYIVTATERNIVRQIIDGVLDIPPSQVIGTEYGYTATNQGDTADADYTFRSDDQIVFDGNYYGENAKTSKVDAIIREIGRQPVLAFGNSSGDLAMAVYTISNNPYRSAAYMVLADDDAREWGDPKNAAEKKTSYEAAGIGTISMRDDWKTIYGEEVKKTAENAEQPKLQQDVLVLFTSDVHCGVDQGFGYVGLKAMKDAAEAAGSHVLLVDDGDSIQGEAVGLLTRGEANIRLMNALGYDLAIPGNHEFDYGMDRFLELAAMADFPYISCNFNRQGELVFAPYIIKEFDGVKIAFVGVTTPKTLTSSTPRYFQNDEGEFIYGFLQDETGESVYSAVQKTVDDARAEGAQYVIVMGHMGNEAAYAPWTYADVIAHTSGIDAFLDGHSHDRDKVVMRNKDGAEVVRQACGTKLEAIGWLRISAKDGSVDTGLYAWGNSVSAPELFGLQNDMTDEVEKIAGEVNEKTTAAVASTPFDLLINDPEAVDENGRPIRIVRRAETNMGDLCADALLDQSGADAVFVSGGCVRVDIPRGDITMNDILSVHPFGSKLTVIEVTGQQLLDALEWGCRAVPAESGAFPQVASLTFEIHTSIESSCTQDEAGMFTGVAGAYRVRNVKVSGEPLDLEKTYSLASHDYLLLDSGDGYAMFAGSPVLQEPGKPDIQVLIDYISGTLGGVIGAEYADPYGQGRIVAVEAEQ